MKKITKNTLLKQGDKKYQPVEIDGVIYWVDENYEWVSPNDINKYGIQYFEKIKEGQIVIFDFVEKYELFKYHLHYYVVKSHFSTPNKPFLIIAQSQPKLEGIPVISPIISLVKKIHNDAQKYAIKTHSPNREAHRRGYIIGYNSNPNKYTQKDIQFAINLAKHTLNYTNEQILEQINFISVIEVDDNFNFISYE